MLSGRTCESHYNDLLGRNHVHNYDSTSLWSSFNHLIKSEKRRRRNSFITKGKYENCPLKYALWEIWEIPSGPEYRMDEKFQNLKIFGVLINFHIEKIL